MEETKQLAQFVVQLQYSDLPLPVIEKAKEIALHAWGVQLAGSTLPWAKAAYRYVQSQGGVPESTILNYGLKTSPVNAAFVNGVFGHGFEMDDNHASTGIKGGCVVIPTALALSEQQHCTGKEFILATVIAYEVMTRTALSLGEAHWKHARTHPTGTHGPFGAAAATGKLLRFSEETMRNVIGIAAASFSGFEEAPATGRGDMKRMFGGMAASNGIRAALLAGQGVTGPITALEGVRGFCRTFGDAPNFAALTAGLGTDWEILQVHYKIYAQDGYIQPMTEALERITRQHRFRPEDVEEIRAGASRHAHESLVGIIREPKDLTSAQFSANFSLALFLVKGGAEFLEYTEDNLHDPAILELSKKIHTEVDEEIELEWQKSKPRGARVTVRLKSGEEYTECVHMLREMTAEEVNEKFRRLATVAVSTDQCERLLSHVHNLDTVRDISSLAPLLTR